MKLKKELTMIAMCIGIFLCMLDTTVMNITLPAIQKGLGVSLNNLSWALNIYTLTFAVLTIPLGRIADIYGKNRIYMLGLLLFMFGSIGCGFSSNASQLIAFRAIQSIGAAIVFPTSMVIGISTTSVEKRQNVIAALGVTQGLAAALGPTIGGVVTQYLGWRWVFLINIPFVLMAIILCLLSFDLKNEEKTFVKVDCAGALFSMLFLFSLTLALVKGREWSWTSTTIGLLFLCSAISLFLLIRREQRCEYPMIPIRLFKNKQFVGASLTVVLSNLFLIGITVILPTFLTSVQGENELHAAFLVTPISAMIFVFSPIAAVLIKKIGAGKVIFFGFFSMTIAYISFANLDVSQNYVQMILTCLLLGFGYGIIVGPITVLAASDFTGELLTASQSVIGVLRQIGTVLAVAIFVSSLTMNVEHAKEASLHYAETEIAKLAIPDEKKEMMSNQVKQQIISGGSKKAIKEHVTDEERASLIEKNYALALKKLATQFPSTDIENQIKKQVRREVDTQIKELNDRINTTITAIKLYTQKRITDSFLILYRYSIPFLVLSCFVAVLFAKKRN